MAFSAQYADYNFCLGVGVNTPKGFVHSTEKLQAEVAKSGRNVGTFVLLMIIADETDAAAFAKWDSYKAGADNEAIAWLGLQASADTRKDTHILQAAKAASAVNFNMGTLVEGISRSPACWTRWQPCPRQPECCSHSMTSSRELRTSARASSP